MQTTSISKIYKDHKPLLNTTMLLNGWVRTIRDSKTFGFIELNDWSYLKNIQIVFEDKLNNFNEICHLGVGSAISVEGTLVASQWWKQDFEIQATKIIIVGTSLPDFPLQKKRHGFKYLREIAHLRTRSNTFSAVFRVRNLLSYAVHKFFQEQEFMRVHTPILTGSDCEGAGDMFRVSTLDMLNPPKTKDGQIDFSKDFFGKETALTVSGQLEWETFACAFGKIYTFGPTFRAENSNTTRHLSEFWMIEPEIAFANLQDNMDLAEGLIKYVFKYVLENAPAEIDFFTQFINPEIKDRVNKLVNSDFARITYTEAIDILTKSGQKFEYPVSRWTELQTEHERYLSEKVFNGPVFVTDYPKEFKAFYMRLSDDKKTVAAMDLLVPGVGEMIGWSQREERLDILTERMIESWLDPEEYRRYLDLRKYGTNPHAGFGVWFERLVMYVTWMENIRDVIPFPRCPKTLEF